MGQIFEHTLWQKASEVVDNNKKWTLISLIVSGVIMVTLIVVMCFQFVKINDYKSRLQDLERQLDEISEKLDDSTSGNNH